MSRLLIHVEGETEESFVNELLAPHLYQRGYTSVGARLVGNARMRSGRGGIRSWESVAGDIVRHLMGDAGCLATTMIDYYAMPAAGRKAWPGRHQAASAPYEQKATIVESAIESDIRQRMGDEPLQGRFIPFVMMHEFEALLFSDCRRFGEAIGMPHLAAAFQAIRDEFDNPEMIDDSPVTAPSMRVQNLVPGYQKPLFGTIVELEIGLETLRSQCPHFADWIALLEGRVAPG